MVINESGNLRPRVGRKERDALGLREDILDMTTNIRPAEEADLVSLELSGARRLHLKLLTERVDLRTGTVDLSLTLLKQVVVLRDTLLKLLSRKR